MSKLLSTPYEVELQKDSGDTNICGPEEQVQQKEPVPETQEVHPAQVSKSELQVSALVKVAPATRTSGCIRNKPDRYGSPPKVLHTTAI